MLGGLQPVNDQRAVDRGVGQRQHVELDQRRGGASLRRPARDADFGRHERERALRLVAKSVEQRTGETEAENRQAAAIVPARAQHAADQPPRDVAQRRSVESDEVVDVERHGWLGLSASAANVDLSTPRRKRRLAAEINEAAMTTHVRQFLCLKDNYGVLVHDSGTGATAAIDAPDGEAVIAAAEAQGWTLTDALVTHHHADHVQGLPALRARYPKLSVVGSGQGGGAHRRRRSTARRRRLRARRPARRQGHRDARPHRRPYRLLVRGGRDRLRRRHVVRARLRPGVRGAAGGDVGIAVEARGAARLDPRSTAVTNTPRPTRASP